MREPVSLQMVESVPQKTGVAEHAPRFAPRPASGERQAAFPRYIIGPSIRAKSEVFAPRRGGFSSRYPPFPIVPAAPLYGRQPFTTHNAATEV